MKKVLRVGKMSENEPSPTLDEVEMWTEAIGVSVPRCP